MALETYLSYKRDFVVKYKDRVLSSYSRSTFRRLKIRGDNIE
jgi:hypothetical protein